MISWFQKGFLVKQLVSSPFENQSTASGLIKKSHMIGTKYLAAVCQLRSTNDKDSNFKMCKQLIDNVVKLGAKIVFLPEAFDFISENKEEALKNAESLEGELISRFRLLAKDNDAWLSLGGFHEKVSDTKIANTHIIINNSGDIVETYRKVHLFDVNIPAKGVKLQESKIVEGGDKIVSPVQTPFGNIGLSICYDLRFPEMGMMLKNLGADILTYPSAFTYATGSLHWETLLRTRAIENQVYVVAAAQCGKHNSKRTSWGHSMVVDPNGTIIGQCPEGIGFTLALIEPSIIGNLSQEMPVWDHRRNDLYPTLLPLNNKKSVTIRNPNQHFQFGQVSVNSDAIFYNTDLTVAFTNKRCIVPGHVLVAPQRVVPRLCELTSTEVADLMQVVQKVESVVEKVYGCSSSTISIQDGPNAGQTIEHVHVHVLPRKPGDFERNDDIYYELEKHDKFDSIPQRTPAEMAKEARDLKQYF